MNIDILSIIDKVCGRYYSMIIDGKGGNRKVLFELCVYLHRQSEINDILHNQS